MIYLIKPSFMSSTTTQPSVSTNVLNKKQKIIQIGCGIVGGAYAVAYKEAGCEVVGIEASKQLIEKYKGQFDMRHITDDMSDIAGVDFIMICVCTPLNKEGALDMSYLLSTLPNVQTILENSPRAHVVIRSTVPPLMTRKYKTLLEAKLGRKTSVLFQPEFLRAKSALEDAKYPWQIVLGSDPEFDVANLIELYSKFIDKSKISIMGIEEAELLKIFHNCFNAAKISFFNQALMLCENVNKQHGTNVNFDNISKTIVKTCEGLLNPKYGTRAGHGYYGTCLPKDSAELARLEKEYGLEVPIYKSVVEVNNVIKTRDPEEVLDGDHHMPYKAFCV
jgi:UDPglucose 6-dehydrogenase